MNPGSFERSVQVLTQERVLAEFRVGRERNAQVSPRTVSTQEFRVSPDTRVMSERSVSELAQVRVKSKL